MKKSKSDTLVTILHKALWEMGWSHNLLSKPKDFYNEINNYAWAIGLNWDSPKQAKTYGHPKDKFLFLFF